jgi:SpoVK/Ycf46/Vps4 family AAA+-type ATPase
MLARLPLIRVPLDTIGLNGGHKQSLLLPIIPGMSDAELLEHIALVKELREAREAARRRGDAFDATKFKLLLGAQPPSARAAIEYIVVKTAGDEVARELGLRVADEVVQRFDAACSADGPLATAMRDAELSLITDLSKRNSMTDADIRRACSPAAQLARYRSTVKRQHMLRDDRLVTKTKFEEAYPEVLELLRAAVAANTNVTYKARGDTPVDAVSCCPPLSGHEKHAQPPRAHMCRLRSRRALPQGDRPGRRGKQAARK